MAVKDDVYVGCEVMFGNMVLHARRGLLNGWYRVESINHDRSELTLEDIGGSWPLSKFIYMREAD